MKPHNVMVMEKQNHLVKLIDFGLSQVMKEDHKVWAKELQGYTPNYAAPEVLDQQPFDEKIDIWGLGLILYELLFQ